MNIKTNIHILIGIYNMLQKYSIDTEKVLLTAGLRQTERLGNSVKISRTTGRVATQPND